MVRNNWSIFDCPSFLLYIKVWISCVCVFVQVPITMDSLTDADAVVCDSYFNLRFSFLYLVHASNVCTYLSVYVLYYHNRNRVYFICCLVGLVSHS